MFVLGALGRKWVSLGISEVRKMNSEYPDKDIKFSLRHGFNDLATIFDAGGQMVKVLCTIAVIKRWTS